MFASYFGVCSVQHHKASSREKATNVVIDFKSINKITFKSIYHAIIAERKNQAKRFCHCRRRAADSARWHNYFAIR